MTDANALADEIFSIVKCTRHEDDALEFLTAHYDAIIAALRATDHHDEAEAYRNRAERAEQECAEKGAEIAAWLRGVAEPLPVNGDKRHILLAVTPAIEARVTGEIVAWLRRDDFIATADALARGDHKENQP